MPTETRFLVGWNDIKLTAIADITALERKTLFKVIKNETISLDHALASAVKYWTDQGEVLEMYAISCTTTASELISLFNSNPEESKELIRQHGYKVFPI